MLIRRNFIIVTALIIYGASQSVAVDSPVLQANDCYDGKVPRNRGGSSLFCVGRMHNGWFSWFGGSANRIVRGDARH